MGEREGGVVHKQEAVLISHAAAEELISLMQGSLSLTLCPTQTHTGLVDCGCM